MSALEDRTKYLENPYFTKHEYGDFSPFYITVAVCSVIAAILFILNIVIGCCSRHTEYWNDKHTGNRWLVSIWTATPHNQPALDYKELEEGYVAPPPQVVYPSHAPAAEYVELQTKRESDI